MHRFDTSHKFWEKYGVRNEHLKKKLGYFSIENINDPYVFTVAVNPKEYLEEIDSQFVNKKHKGLRERASQTEFEDYAKNFRTTTKRKT